MSEITTSKKINIDQLGFESKIDLNTVVKSDGTVIIQSSAAQKTLEQFVNAHNADDNWINPTPPRQVTIEEKLAMVGLNIVDLKSALGL